MRIFLATFVAGMLVVAGFNAYVDPALRWHRTALNQRLNWRSNQVLIMPHDFDERQFRHAHLRLIPPPALMLFGSSRVRTVRSDFFAQPDRVYNAGMSVATVQDYLALWQALLNFRKAPSHLVIFTDPWLFMARSESRWISNRMLYEQYLRRRALENGTYDMWTDWMTVLIERMESSWDEFKDLFSWTTFRTSWQDLRSGRVDKASRLVPLDNPEAWRHVAVRSDGAWSADRLSKRDLSLGHIQIATERLADLYLRGKGENPDNVRLFEDFLNDARRHGVAVALLDPPLNPTAFSILQRHPADRLALDRHRKILQHFSSEVPVCEALDPATVGCGVNEFVDEGHMDEGCIEKVIASCFHRWGWDELLNARYRNGAQNP